MPRTVKPVTVLEQPKARKARTTTGAAQPEVIHAAPVEDETPESLYEKVRFYADRYWQALKQPTWKRRIFAMLSGLVTFSAVYFYGMQLIELLAVAMLAFSGPGFLTFTILFIGIFLVFMGAVTAGNYVTKAVMAFDYANVKSRIGRFFGGVSETLGVDTTRPAPAR